MTHWSQVLLGSLILTVTLSGCLSVDLFPQPGPDHPDEASGAGRNETAGQDDQEPTNITLEGNDGPDTEPGIESVAPVFPSAELSADYTTLQEETDVTFQLEGSHPDGATLDWSLEVEEDHEGYEGTGLPATITHRFDDAGEHDAVLLVRHNNTFGMSFLTILVLEGPNDPQSEQGATCLHRTAIEAGVYDAVALPKEAAGNATVEVDAMTQYRLHASEEETVPGISGQVFVDFFDEGGEWLGSDGDHPTHVPGAASYGVVCVAATPSAGTQEGQTQLDESVPMPWRWHYQDGFIDPVP